jgi:hypothetical protein
MADMDFNKVDLEGQLHRLTTVKHRWVSRFFQLKVLQNVVGFDAQLMCMCAFGGRANTSPTTLTPNTPQSPFI